MTSHKKSFAYAQIAILILPLFFINIIEGRAQDLPASEQKILIQNCNELISIDAQDTKLSEVFYQLSKDYHFNFIASSETKNKIVNLNLNNIPLCETIESILISYDLFFDFYPKLNLLIIKDAKEKGGLILSHFYYLDPSKEFFKDPSYLSNIKSLLTEDGSIYSDATFHMLIISDRSENFNALEKALSPFIKTETTDVTPSVPNKMGTSQEKNLLEQKVDAIKKELSFQESSR